MPRRLHALLAIVCLLALPVLAACGGDGDEAAGGADAAALLDDAFSNHVERATIELAVEAKDLEGGSVSGGSVELKGPYEAPRERSRVPRFDFEVSVSGGLIRFDGGLVSTGDNAFVTFQGQAYEVGEELVRQLEQRMGQRERRDGLSLRELGIDPARWVRDPKTADGGEVGGDETTRVSGSLDVTRLIEDLERAGERAGSAGERSQLTGAQRRQLAQAVKEAEVSVWVADEDRTLRRFTLELRFEVPEAARQGAGGLRSGRFRVDLSLSRVGEPAEVEPPRDARPLEELLQRFGGSTSALPQLRQ